MGELIQHKRETIHWRETVGKSGNPFALNPRSGMLTRSGIIILRSFKPMGRKWGRETATEWFDVHYDEDYVTEWLLHRVVGCFPGITHVQMRLMFTKALKLRKEVSEGEKSSAIEALRQPDTQAEQSDVGGDYL